MGMARKGWSSYTHHLLFQGYTFLRTELLDSRKGMSRNPGIQDYQYKFEYKQGKLNRGVEALSGNPVANEQYSESTDSTDSYDSDDSNKSYKYTIYYMFSHN